MLNRTEMLTKQIKISNEQKKKHISSFSILIVFLCLTILGLFFIPLLPLKLNPSRNIPVVHISFSMWGQSARAVEMEVTSKLEAMLARAEGVQQIESSSYNGGGDITIRLSKHVNPDMARFEVSTIVRQTWSALPQGVSYPSISMSGVGDESSGPFLRYIINAPQSPREIQKYVENTIKPKLAVVKGVNKVDIHEAGRMIYKLEYDYKQLSNLGINTGDIHGAIHSYLTKESLGLAKLETDNNNDQWVRVALVANDKNETFDPSKIQVRNRDGRIMYLDQLVRTTYEEEASTSMFRINGQNIINFAITAEEGENQLLLSNQVQQIISQLEADLPESYTLRMTYDAGEYIKEQLDKIYFRSGLTILILLCFVFLIYRNVKYSFLIICSLITNMSIAAIFYYLFDIEMQIYSLAGLTISLTLIIDNTIIMSDQIIQQGNKKAFMAILAATLTTIGSLVIIFFMDESIRLKLIDFAFVIIINLTISLITALFFVPALLEKLNISKREPDKIGDHNKGKFATLKKKLKNRRNLVYFNNVYQRVICFMYRRKVWFIVTVILLFGIPVFMLPNKLENKKMNEHGWMIVEEPNLWQSLYNNTIGSTVYQETIKPVVDVALGGTMRLFANEVRNGSYGSGDRQETTLNITASMPNGTTLQQINALIEEMEEFISQFKEVRLFETYVDNGQRARISVFFQKNHQRGAAPHRLQSEFISKALTLGGGSWQVYGVGDGFNNEIKEQAGSSRIKLLGFNYDELTMQAESIRDSLLQMRRIKEVTIDSEFSWYKKDYMEYVFEMDKQRLAYENIHPNDIFHTISPIFTKNNHVTTWVSEEEITPISITSKMADKIDIWDLEHEQSYVGEKGYKIGDIAQINKYQTSQNIAKENQQYRLCLQYEYIGSYQQANNVIERTINSFNQRAPLGYKAETDEYRYWWEKGGSNQYWLLLLIFAIMFLTTSILFNSIKQPFIVIFIIPMSFIGIFLTFYFFNLNFDQGGFAAFILLSGLAINSNIYVLNEYNNIRRDHPRLSLMRSYLKAWNLKIKPISLTILSTVLGFIPFMIGEHKEAFWFPLAAGASGGLVFSLLALFLFLPLCMGIGKKDK